ncbi:MULTISPECIES: cold shock domain-containing protein [unclassified Bradyrhizobium]|uniref:cold shock domain-containing protein n=1 Tax=unclassified Bradyrhizobium TaxID=2631580 RepID=UPI001FFB231E|nr:MULTISPECIES: cold shock domain-containing protein [unclassified Bradyrhizobium]
MLASFSFPICELFHTLQAIVACVATGIVKWFNGERAGLSSLAEDQKVSYEAQVDQKRGKNSAENLCV